MPTKRKPTKQMNDKQTQSSTSRTLTGTTREPVSLATYSQKNPRKAPTRVNLPKMVEPPPFSYAQLNP